MRPTLRDQVNALGRAIQDRDARSRKYQDPDDPWATLMFDEDTDLLRGLAQSLEGETQKTEEETMTTKRMSPKERLRVVEQATAQIESALAMMSAVPKGAVGYKDFGEENGRGGKVCLMSMEIDRLEEKLDQLTKLQMELYMEACRGAGGAI